MISSISHIMPHSSNLPLSCIADAFHLTPSMLNVTFLSRSVFRTSFTVLTPSNLQF